MYELHPCSNNEHRFMKLSLFDNMLKVIEYNLNRKNNLYPIAYFKRNELLDSFVKLLNKRAEFVLWEIKNPDYKEHELALKEFEEKENLKKQEN